VPEVDILCWRSVTISVAVTASLDGVVSDTDVPGWASVTTSATVTA